MSTRARLVFLCLAFALTAPGAGQAQFQLYRPVQDKTPLTGQPQVVNTSTLALNGKRIVFHGIDPMMAKNPCYIGNRLWDCGAAAFRILLNFVGREPVTCEPRVTDNFGRLFSRCTVHGEDIAMHLIEQGMAVALPEETPDYVDAEKKAKAEKKGIWQGTFTTPSDFREIQTGHPQAR